MIRLLSLFSGTPEDRIRAAWSDCLGEFGDLWPCLRLAFCAYGLALGLLALLALGGLA